MRFLIAPQEFKGSLSARQAAAAIAEGVLRALPEAEVDLLPMADGGPELRWTNPEVYGRPFTGYVELEFGPTVDGTEQQLYFYANGHTRAIRLSDGASIFTIGGNNQQPRVSPLPIPSAEVLCHYWRQ